MAYSQCHLELAKLALQLRPKERLKERLQKNPLAILEHQNMEISVASKDEEFMTDRMSVSRTPLKNYDFDSIMKQEEYDLRMFIYDCSSVFSKKLVDTLKKSATSYYLNLQRNSPLFKRNYKAKKFVGTINGDKELCRIFDSI